MSTNKSDRLPLEDENYDEEEDDDVAEGATAMTGISSTVAPANRRLQETKDDAEDSSQDVDMDDRNEEDGEEELDNEEEEEEDLEEDAEDDADGKKDKTLVELLQMMEEYQPVVRVWSA
jgi:hypothetical protein